MSSPRSAGAAWPEELLLDDGQELALERLDADGGGRRYVLTVAARLVH